MYRPFAMKWSYYSEDLFEYPSKYRYKMGRKNKIIFTTGTGISRDFSCIMIDTIPNYHLMDTGQAFMLYNNSQNDNFNSLFDKNIYDLSEFAINYFGLSEEELFYYVYGVLHSNEYKIKYANDLKKDYPRIPLLKNKMEFVDIGKKLADLHLNYESIEPYPHLNIESKLNPSYKVKKMKHPKKGVLDKIIFNDDITISEIPLKAYEYMINGRTAIAWIMESYQLKVDKKSNIVDDPNLFSEDEKYIFNLLLRIINLSVQTVDLVNSIPPLEFVD